MASMSGAEEEWGDFAGLEFVVGPLCALRIVTEEGDGDIVLVEDRDSAFQLGDDGVVPVKTYLAWAAQMLSDSANEFSVEVEMTEAAIFAVAHQEQRLVIAHIDSESMVAIEQAFRVALAGITRFVVAVFVEPEKPRVTVTIGDEDGAVRGGHRGSQPPFIRSFEAGLGWSSDLLHHGSVGLHFDKYPVLF